MGNNQTPKVIVKCSICNRNIAVHQYRTKTTKRFYCSSECYKIGSSVFRKGFHHTEGAKRKISMSHKGKSNIKKSIALIGRKITWADKISNTLKGRYSLEKHPMWRGKTYGIKCKLCGKDFMARESDHRVFCSKKCAYLSFKYRKFSKTQIKKMLCRNKISTLEDKYSEIINEVDNDFIFVGNGGFFIGRKVPDFVDKENKIAIEVYYRRHKEMFREGGLESWKKQRKEYFSEHGWKVIFLDETQINKNIVLNAIGDIKSQ